MSAKTALAALDSLDDVKGTSRASSNGKQGVSAALVGLHAVEQKPKQSKWRAAVASALIGLSVLTTFNPAAREIVTARPQTFSLVEKKVNNPISVRMMAGGPPPDSRPGVSDIIVQQVRGGLPDTLATLLTGMTVVHGSDPGDFYCEHAFFTSTAEALRAGTSILRNAHNEVLTGFLHVPPDRFTYTRYGDDANAVKVQAERHSERRDIVGAAIRGFYEDARQQLNGGDFRMLLTGYSQWGSVVDNPTGDFTGHAENVDAAMRRAFGADLITREGRVVTTRDDAAGMKSTVLEYQVKDDEARNGVRMVIVEAAQLPVTDEAINGGASSLQRLIERGRPHAVMSMGVAGGSAYQAEFHADDGGLKVDEATGAITHSDGVSASRSHPDNYALGRAIHRGHQLNDARPILVATTSTVVSTTTAAATLNGGGE